MATVLDIWNEALGELGQDKHVESPDEVSIPAARCRLYYPSARDMVLSHGVWDFNTRVFSPVSAVNVPLFGWRGAFLLPPDFLGVINVVEKGQNPDIDKPIKYNVRNSPNGAYVFCNHEEIVVKILWREENTQRYHPDAAIAVSKCLAWRMCPSFYQGKDGVSIAQAKFEEFSQMLKYAENINARQGNVWTREPSSFQKARNGGCAPEGWR